MAYLSTASHSQSTRRAAPNPNTHANPYRVWDAQTGHSVMDPLSGHDRQIPPTIPRPLAKRDPYYGHEPISRLCARYVTHLFECPKYPPSSTKSRVTLPLFIAYALYRTKLDPSVTYAALVLITRLKCRYSSGRGISGHRLFLVAFMLASKQMCDDTYSNKSWTIVGQGVFSLGELNRMEREMCGIVKWQLNVCNLVLRKFEAALKHDFCEGKEEYPTYPSTLVSKLGIESAGGASSTGQISSFQEGSDSSWETPRDVQALDVGDLDDSGSESPSCSTWSSPASSGPPATPEANLDYGARIKGVDSSPLFALADDMRASANRPLKNQTYSVVTPGVW